MPFELTCDNVIEVTGDCLPPIVPEKCVIIRGIVSIFGFAKEKLEARAQDITDMLNQLPVEFSPESGGGTSFLQACNNRDGVQWGEHREMDALFCLGMAIGRVTSLMPRELWKALPGSMPYYCVDTSKPVVIPEEQSTTEYSAKVKADAEAKQKAGLV